MDVDDEARRLVAAFQGQPAQLLTFLSNQLSVLKTQAQMFMGLCGLVITVTGFSGHNMVRSGPLSWGPMVAGIAAVLVGSALTLRVMGRLRWVTQDLDDDLVATAAAVIRRRDHQQRVLQVAGGFVTGGLAGYLMAVVVSALHSGGALP